LDGDEVEREDEVVANGEEAGRAAIEDS